MLEGRWITEAEVVGVLDIDAAIAAVRDGLLAEARGEAQNMVKTHTAWDGHTLHAIGAAFPDAGVVGTKTWAHTAGGAAPLLVMFGADDGRVVAIIEAFALGQLRTASVSGLATDLLAAPAATTMAMIGTGKQALAQVAAVAAVRPIDEVRCFSPNAQHRAAFVSRVDDELGLAAVDCDSVESAVDGAAVVTLATRATEPFLAPGMVNPGTHVNAIGAITPERAEFDPALLERAAVVTADSVEQARALSAELQGWPGELVPLRDVVAASAGRPDGADVTVCKAMGMGTSDLALGLAVLRAAEQGGLGQPLPARRRAAPHLRSLSATKERT